MEFKGTKVFPKYVGGDNYSVDLIFDNGATISIDRRCRYSDNVVCERSEMEANALLISKAPEMLEMLEEMIGLSEALCQVNDNISKYPSLIKKAKQLIKEATEL
jgi:hypothetical protein